MTYNIYADVLKKMGTIKLTENGAVAYNTTEDATVDLFSTIGAMRNGDSSMERVAKMVDASYYADPLLTAKILFYARDVRGGMGERDVFRKAIYHCAKNHPDLLECNLHLISEYGRWDDMFSLIGTPLEYAMWGIVIEQLKKDTSDAESGKPISLLAKWMPSADTSSEETRKLASYCAKKMGMSIYDYKRYIRNLRKHLNLLETNMSSKKWNEIDYSTIPSQAHLRHTEAFYRNDGDRYTEYLNDLADGKTDIKADTLFPYEIIERICIKNDSSEKSLELMWKNLPNYVGNGGNVIIVADTSGSMFGRPMAVSVSLALYFAERNTGPFGGMYMTFSDRPEMIQVDSSISLRENYRKMYDGPWGCNTDLAKALRLLLDVAVKTRCPQKDLPKAIAVITDMEIDSCEQNSSGWNTIVDVIDSEFREHGYTMPNLIFWNVASRHNTFLGKSNRKGVQMVSGSSASVFKAVLGFMNGMTAREAMEQVLNDERYAPIKVGTTNI